MTWREPAPCSRPSGPDHAAAQATGRTSASEAYVSLHASYDLLFPPLLTASLAFCGFAALFRPSRPGQSPRLAAVGFGLVLVLAFTYLACDLTENAVADAMFGPEALASEFNQDSVFVLRVLTTGKYVTVSLAFALIIALWTWRWMAARRGEPTASGG
jgi:Na+-translocating ferredoxin:NAD+ oxidoreductase RnfE subunit